MPVYDAECTECGYTTELRIPSKEYSKLHTCPTCTIDTLKCLPPAPMVGKVSSPDGMVSAKRKEEFALAKEIQDIKSKSYNKPADDRGEYHKQISELRKGLTKK